MSKENFKKEKTKYIALALSNIKTPGRKTSSLPMKDCMLQEVPPNYTYLENCINIQNKYFHALQNRYYQIARI